MYPSLLPSNESELERQLVRAHEQIDAHLRDEKVMAYPTNCKIEWFIPGAFADFSQRLCSQFNEIDLDKCLQYLPMEEVFTEPLEAILQRRSILCMKTLIPVFNA